jgi:hypothetical protein
MDMACSTDKEKRNLYRILVKSQKERDHWGRPRCRWVDNIKIYLREKGWDFMDWVNLAQELEGSCEHGNENSGSIKFWDILE